MIDTRNCGALLLTFGTSLPLALPRPPGGSSPWRVHPEWTASATAWRSSVARRMMDFGGGGCGGPAGHAVCVMDINYNATGKRVWRVEDTGSLQVYDLLVTELLSLDGAALWMVPAGERVLHPRLDMSIVARGDAAVREARSDFPLFGSDAVDSRAEAARRRFDQFVSLLD